MRVLLLIFLFQKSEYKVVPHEVKKAVQKTIGHEIAVEFAQQLLLGLMEYIDLDKMVNRRILVL